MSTVKIGMISFAHGHAAGIYRLLQNIPGVKVTAIADENSARVREYLEEAPGIRYYADYRELLADDCDAVVICSENIRHAEMTVAAARAGKHVLCEKPLGLNVDEMERMVRACEESGVRLMTAFPCRFLPAVIQAKTALDRGEIGEIVAVKGTNRGTMPGGWFVDPALSGGGALLDHSVHVMDLLNWMLGSHVTEVYAETATLFHDIPVEDTGFLHVKFENGAFASIDTSWSRTRSFPYWGDVTLEIVGTAGMLSVDAFGQKNEVYSDGADKARWSHWGENMNRTMVEAFIGSVREGKEVPVTGRDGLRSAAVAAAAYESVRRGGPVGLNEHGRYAVE
ncbi:Gfo/Idh/MocA family protein [Paenibacillus chitinolyticus]|uniref:Gfo/Idh/MocA family protein n=1 Tax=Paenibacillus chitinolyticus TaxID=79263 RepID=UPI003640C4B4